MPNDDLQDVVKQLSETLLLDESSQVWKIAHSLSQKGGPFLRQALSALGEGVCRQLIEHLLTMQPLPPQRQLAPTVACLGSQYEVTSALVLSYLVDRLRTATADQKFVLLKAVGKCGAQGAFATLLEAKVFGDAETRCAVAQGIGMFQPNQCHFIEGRLVLADMLLHDPTLSVQMTAIEAMESHVSSQDSQALLQGSMSQSPQLRQQVKRLLTQGYTATKPTNHRTKLRILKYYVRQFSLDGSFQFLKEFEAPGQHIQAEGREDRELIDPFFVEKQVKEEGDVHYLLQDGRTLTKQYNGSILFELGKHDWRTRNSITGLLTIRSPIQRTFSPVGIAVYGPKGVLKVRTQEGGIEEEGPDGRRILISPLGLVQVISPRREQGIQIDAREELMEKYIDHLYVLVENQNGQHTLYGGNEESVPPAKDVARTTRLPYGALRMELRDGRVTREIVAGEVTHELIGGRTVTFIPRNEVTPVIGLKTFGADGSTVIRYTEDLDIETVLDGARRYTTADGSDL